MSTTNAAANYIASISAFIGLCSAFVAFLSYRKTVEHHEASKRETFISKCSSNLDDCYMEINDFVSGYSGSEESKEKRTSRDKILYLIEDLRVSFDKNQVSNTNIKSVFSNLEMKMSDITYEDNFEKVARDLGSIKNEISSLKNMLSV